MPGATDSAEPAMRVLAAKSRLMDSLANAAPVLQAAMEYIEAVRETPGGLCGECSEWERIQPGPRLGAGELFRRVLRVRAECPGVCFVENGDPEAEKCRKCTWALAKALERYSRE